MSCATPALVLTFFLDIFSHIRGQEILQARQQENQGVPSGEDHDGAGDGLPHTQHPPHHPGHDRGVSAGEC